MVTEPLSKEAAEALFRQEAVFFFTADAIPEYRIVDLFGEQAAFYLDKNTKHNRLLVGGRDYNEMGSCSTERPMLNYMLKAGFMKVVTEHNYLYSIAAHKKSNGGHVLDSLWKEKQRAEGKTKKATAKADGEE